MLSLPVTGRIIALAVVLASPARAEDDGFVTIFDGKTLAGWVGQDMSWWSVEDGAITGTIWTNRAPAMNQYLVWTNELVEDFELKLESRIAGEKAVHANGGFQFRSRRLPDGDVAGYQIDNNRDTPWKVRIYDEFGRHDLARPGERTVFDARGKKSVERFMLEPAATNFSIEAWHEYHLKAVGPKIELRINGNLIAEATDNDADSFEARGILAMQLHTGPPQQAQFRNIRLKKLGPAPSPSQRDALRAEAALLWDLGERLDAHSPRMTPRTNIVAELTAPDTSARFTRFDRSYFDLQMEFNKPRHWNVAGDAMTVLLRARVPDGTWNSALLAKRGNHAVCNFNLFSTDLPDTRGPDIGFELRTDAGFFMVSFPVSKIDPTVWLDLAGRYDGTKIQVLCNGRVMAEKSAHGKLTANNEPLLIGAETADGKVVRPFTGEMELAALWSRALSDAELAAVLSSDWKNTGR